ncbi:MAG: glycoside hydrolase family 16 protein [Bacteroidales bacterium]|nr:glycoside hydrolase family 16 protein [Bacteroidales bacterium]
MILRNLTVFLTVLFYFFLASCGGNKESNKPIIILPGPPQDLGWTFEEAPFWFDEFDYNGLPDPAKWGYDIGGGGWGNNELQYYTSLLRNASVGNGLLTITALKEQFENRQYTSTRLVSKNKGDILYGRVEVKAKIPAGRGTWPAIWMLPTDWEYGNWPSSGEIDIMEHVGYDLNVIHMSTHCEAYYWRLNNQKTATRKVENATTEFQIYRIDWTPYAIRGYINNQHLFTSVNEGGGYKVWPFDKRFHLILNIAIGGDWGGQQGIDDNIFPASMEIDYVRFYRMNPKTN